MITLTPTNDDNQDNNMTIKASQLLSKVDEAMKSKSLENYNKSSVAQLEWILRGSKNIKKLVPQINCDSGNLLIADFGCSHGKNSISVMNQLLDEMRNRGELVQKLKDIKFIHEDLPSNDFEAVRNCIEDPELGYLNNSLIKDNNINVNFETIGKSYYGQVLPNSSVDIAFCYTSLHWMPEYRPTNYGLCYTQEIGDFEQTEWFDNMSTRYLTLWLNLRYGELKKGGLLSFNLLSPWNFLPFLNQNWIKLLKSKGLDYKEFNKVVFPVYCRSREAINSTLDKFNDKFEIIHWDYYREPSEFNRAAFRAVIKSQIVPGLAQYPNHFPDENSRLKLYEEFEELSYSGIDSFMLDNAFDWVVLKKL